MYQDHPAHQTTPGPGDPAVEINLRLHQAGAPPQALELGKTNFVTIEIYSGSPNNPDDIRLEINSSLVADTPQDLADLLEDTAIYLRAMTTDDQQTPPPVPARPDTPDTTGRRPR